MPIMWCCPWKIAPCQRYNRIVLKGEYIRNMHSGREIPVSLIIGGFFLRLQFKSIENIGWILHNRLNSLLLILCACHRTMNLFTWYFYAICIKIQLNWICIPISISTLERHFLTSSQYTWETLLGFLPLRTCALFLSQLHKKTHPCLIAMTISFKL